MKPKKKNRQPKQVDRAERRAARGGRHPHPLYCAQCGSARHRTRECDDDAALLVLWD